VSTFETSQGFEQKRPINFTEKYKDRFYKKKKPYNWNFKKNHRNVNAVQAQGNKRGDKDVLVLRITSRVFAFSVERRGTSSFAVPR
jgi:hypothetical protein